MLTKENIEKYFIAEKAGSLLFIVMGIAAITTAAICFFIAKPAFCKGAILPLIVMGFLFTITGFTIYNSSDAYRTKNVYALTMNPGELKEKEQPRMEKVIKIFVWYRAVEIALIVVALSLLVYFNNKETYAYWKGFGFSLGIMMILALAANYFAVKRGAEYFQHLKEFNKDK